MSINVVVITLLLNLSTSSKVVYLFVHNVKHLFFLYSKSTIKTLDWWGQYMFRASNKSQKEFNWHHTCGFISLTPLKASHHLTRFCGHRHCVRAIMVFLCDLISEDHMVKGSCELLMVSDHPAKLVFLGIALVEIRFRGWKLDWRIICTVGTVLVEP